MTRTLVAVLAFGVIGAVAAPSYAENEADVTYYKDVLPIMQENCQSCHRPSGQNISGLIAPMAFMSYEETRPWARSSSHTRSAFCACSRFSLSSQMTLCGPSMTSAVTS